MPEPKAKRQRISFAQRLERMNARIARLEDALSKAREDRIDLIGGHRAKAEAMLQEAGGE